MIRSLRLALVSLGVVALAGCSVPPMPPPGTSAPPQASSPPSTRPTRTPAAPPVTAVADTTPSADALAVLQSIPDPLPPGERVPPPEVRVAPPDSALETPVDASPDTATGEIPVPEPTFPLGLAPPPAPDTTASTLPPPETSPPPPPPPSPLGPGTGAAPSSAPDTCWRVQVAAPTEQERERADQMREAAESQLLVPMAVELEARRFKVRTRDCMSREAADRLKKRAEASGFTGAFRFAGPRR